MPATAVIATDLLGSSGSLATQLLALAIWAYAIMQVVKVPREQWAHGRWSKAAWILTAGSMTINPGGIVLPLGAGAALWAARRARRRDHQPAWPARAAGTEARSVWTEEDS